MRSPLLLLTLCALPLAAACQTADPERLASREEYAACLDQGDAIERRKADLDKRYDEHRQLSAKIRAADERLAAQVRAHAPRTRHELASYNEATRTRNKATADYNERGQALDKEQQRLNDSIFAHNAHCGSLRIDREVKEAVDAERRR